MSSLELRKIKQKVVDTATQPLYIGGVATDNSDAVATINNGNISIKSGAKIQGDFSNATVANRTMFQTSTANNHTAVSVIPNGTATTSYVTAHNSSDTTNYSTCSVTCTATLARVSSISFGTAPNLPLSFYVAGSDKATLDTNGNFLLLSGGGAFGYGTGSGGTVTQLTSKSTGVTLNKPYGQIIMNNATLAAGASVTFTVNNSIMNGAAIDAVLVSPVFNTVIIERYRVEAFPGSFGGGGFLVKVTNVSAISLSDAVVLNFAVIKGATA